MNDETRVGAHLICKSCGKPMGPDNNCADCTLTDMNVPHVRVISTDSRTEADAYLVETRTKQRHAIAGTKWKVGRDPTNQVVIEGDPYTSRFHAWITFEEGHYFVEDLGSTNGTLLNGQPLIRRRPLVNGDRVRVGRTDFTFVVEGMTAAGQVRENSNHSRNG